MNGTSGTAGAAYHFLPWVRQGAATAIPQPDTLGAGLPGRAPVPVKLRVNDAAADEVAVPLRLYGPGDVIGIDPREIVRVEPRPLTPDFPPHYFPFVEFDRPDFPWLFTPARATADTDRLRPWIVLVVVHKQDARLSVDPRRPLPALECARSELPDLAESWAWAHAQYSGTLAAGQTIAGALADRPQQTVSRLLCPRRLRTRQGGTDAGYLACLVPAFDVGVKAGLGVPVTADDERELRPAWEAATATTAGQRVTLPVYYRWEFGTGDEGDDFEELVDRLTPLKTLPDVPPRVMDLSRPGGGLKDVPGASLGLASALRTGASTRPDWPPELPVTFDDFKRRLQAVLEASFQPVGAVTQGPAPPIYGHTYAGDAATGPRPGTAPLAEAAPAWLRGINLDPGYRVAASLGAQVVQQQQESLVAAAWEQAGQLESVNRWLCQKQHAREVTLSVHERRLKPLSSTALQQITAPATIPAAPPGPSESPTRPPGPPAPPPEPPGSASLREAVLSTTFRRVTRPLGPLARQATMADGTAHPTGTAADVGRQLAGVVERATIGEIRLAPAAGVFEGAAAVTGYRPEPIAMSAVRGNSPRRGPAPSMAGPDNKAALLKQLDPSETFTREAQARVEMPPEMASIWGRPDPLAPVTVTPRLSQPMYEPLRDLFPDMLLPGLDRVPYNRITLLVPDPAFIEAYMLGLNHEMSCELLWREFPTDLRGTYFRQFWDVRGGLASDATEAQREALRDVPPIAQWQGALGSNMPADRAKDLRILLIKGDLLRRYPDALIYAAKAKWSTNPSGQPVAPAVVDDAHPPSLPVLRVDPGFGVTLLGFNLPDAAGVAAPPGDAGYFFVIQEHPTEPRFGLDVSSDRLNTWRELSWKQVPTRDDDSGYISLKGPAPTLTVVDTGPDKTPDADRVVAWDRNAAHQAYITLQKPYRVEIHARFWLR
jgi:hypothetical protein